MMDIRKKVSVSQAVIFCIWLAWRNHIADCGGPAILAVADCRAVLQSNDVRECLSGVKVVGKHSEIQMRSRAKMVTPATAD